MIPILSLFLSMLRSCFRTRASMQIEILALRHQLAVATRRRKRPSLGSLDRALWVTLSRFWSRWRAALVIVKPATVIGWQRKGFRLYWRWKSRAGKSGRPCRLSLVPVSTRISDLNHARVRLGSIPRRSDFGTVGIIVFRSELSFW